MPALLASEWVKLRSVRSTHHALGVAALVAVLGAGWAYYVGTVWDGRDAAGRAAFGAAAPEEGFLPLLQVGLAVLGVLAITAEYATGTICTSVTAVPARHRLLAAKTAVVAATAFSASAAVLLVTWGLSRWIAGDRTLGFNAAPLAAELPALLASALSVTVLAIVGLGLGAVTRSTAGAITAVVGLLFVLPGVGAYLPAPWNTRLSSFLLPELVPQIVGERLSRRLGDGVLPPMVALAGLIAYAVVALGAAAIVLARRDV
ncbi:ABC transporter permease [Pseudonocardia nigra]|uniref:ABC transporter permease n=1 Tax=Pseudonocardia nigra TaxID=1921578 RepID=UPI001C5FA1CB|nr:ABC transporter permease [Pseudonocardia nigra]